MDNLNLSYVGYKIDLTKRACKELKHFPLEIRKFLVAKILLLRTDIKVLNIKKLKGSSLDLERIKAHPYRIIFKVYKDKKKILVLTALHRKDIYRTNLT